MNDNEHEPGSDEELEREYQKGVNDKAKANVSN